MVANHVSFFGAKLDKVLAAAARTRPCESLRQSFILAATGGHCPLLGGSFPVSKWLITMVSKSPTWGYSPYKWPKLLVARANVRQHGVYRAPCFWLLLSCFVDEHRNEGRASPPWKMAMGQWVCIFGKWMHHRVNGP